MCVCVCVCVCVYVCVCVSGLQHGSHRGVTSGSAADNERFTSVTQSSNRTILVCGGGPIRIPDLCARFVHEFAVSVVFFANVTVRLTASTGRARSTTPTGGARSTTPTGGARCTTLTGGARSTTPTGGLDPPHPLVGQIHYTNWWGQIHHMNW